MSSRTRMVEKLEQRRLMSGTAVLEATYLAGEFDGGARLGTSLASAGGRVVAGSHLTDVNGVVDAGAVRVYDHSLGVLQRTLTKPSPVARDFFGQAVAADATHILVGAPSSDEGGVDAGNAYLFDAATGKLLTTFINPTPASGDQFGAAVALIGDSVLIGARGDDTAASNAGAAYLFSKSGTHLATFFSSNPTSNDYFGNAVTGDPDRVVIGAYYDDRTGLRSGAVYVYSGAARGTSNTPLLVIDNPTPAADDHFGISVALFNDTLVVGAEADDALATNAGAAHQFQLSTGQLIRTFHNPAPGSADYFGWSVAVQADRIAVGAIADDTVALNSGAAYVFDAATGALTHTVLNPAGRAGDNLGATVAFVNNDVLLVGATGVDSVFGTDSGAVYSYLLLDPLL